MRAYWHKRCKDPRFRALQVEWYQRARKSGFKDVEVSRPELWWKGIDPGDHYDDVERPFNQAVEVSAAQAVFRGRLTTEYYTAAGQWYWEHDWSRYGGQVEKYKRVWALHVAGLMNKDVADEVCMLRDEVDKVIRRLRADWAVSKGSPHLGTMIREARKRRGISVSVLAEAVGVGHRTIQRFQSGERVPSEATLRKIARVLGVHRLWFGDDDEST